MTNRYTPYIEKIKQVCEVYAKQNVVLDKETGEVLSARIPNSADNMLLNTLEEFETKIILGVQK